MIALDSIRKDTVLLRNEIIRLTMGGWTLDLSDKVFGYVFNPYSDSIQEMEVRRLEVIDEGFYGLQLPTLISIAEALKRN